MLIQNQTAYFFGNPAGDEDLAGLKITATVARKMAGTGWYWLIQLT